MAEAFAAASGQEHHLYYSVDKSGRGDKQRSLRYLAADVAWKVPPKTSGDLHGRLPLAIGMPVFCTENIATEFGISNGSEGTVARIAYMEEQGKRFATSVEVDFIKYTGPVIVPGHSHRVVLTPTKQAFSFTLPGSDHRYTATRWQVPIIPAFAHTCHNSQGRSLTRATVDLASAAEAKDKTALAYVMLSRLRSLEGLTILRPFPFSVISTRASQQVRSELQRVDHMSDASILQAHEDLAWFYDRQSE
ncbi:hypothetical protein V8E36_008292 [Tilletia maclaganii]